MRRKPGKKGARQAKKPGDLPAQARKTGSVKGGATGVP